MRISFGSHILNMLSTTRFTLIGLIIYAVLLASATIIERFYGSDFARYVIYNNPLFYLLQLLLILNFACVSVKRNILHSRKYSTLLIHSALILILCGAYITSTTGKEGIMHVREGESVSEMLQKTGEKTPLPYTIKLDKFEAEYYSGSQYPSSYSSKVIVTAKGISRKADISMNNILYVDGHRLYQTSYDSDMSGTILTVNTDLWGTVITYIGYVLLLIGFITSFLCRNSRIRIVLRALSESGGKTLSISAIFLFCSISVMGSSPQIPENLLIPEQDGKKWERIYVQNDNGRIEPLECYARRVLRKITHSEPISSDKWGARLYISMIMYPEQWAAVPIIYCGDKELKWRLGLGDSDYISFDSMFSAEGDYLLDQNHSFAENNKIWKSIKKLDEKARIFANLYGNLKIFPNQAETLWSSPISDLSSLDISREDSVFISTFNSVYLTGLKNHDKNITLLMLDKVEDIQRLNTKGAIPSSSDTSLSIFYSRAPIFRISAFGYLVTGFLLAFAVFLYMQRKTILRQLSIASLEGVVIAFFMLHTLGIAVRWYISKQPPWSNTYETMVYVAWITLLVGLIFIKKYPIVITLSSIMGAVTLLISELNWLDPQITPLVPVLKSPWLMLHVTVVTASYGFFGICALLGITNLILFFKSTPNYHLIKELRLINELSAFFGLILLAAGTFLGAVWANMSWGRYWGWDAKETWALITIVVYTVLTHLYLVKRLRGDLLFSALSVYALLSVVVTYIGVNYYFTGLHSYGTVETPPAVGIIASIYAVITIFTMFVVLRRCVNRKKNRP